MKNYVPIIKTLLEAHQAAYSHDAADCQVCREALEVLAQVSAYDHKEHEAGAL